MSNQPQDDLDLFISCFPPKNQMSDMQAAQAAKDKIEVATERALRDKSLWRNGTLYSSVLDEAVEKTLKEYGGDGVENRFVGIFQMRHFRDDVAIEDALKGTPRGTWAVIEKTITNREDDSFYKRYTYVMSDGLGGTQGKYDHYDEPPTFEKARSRMVGYETYTARGKVEKRMDLEARKELLDNTGIKPGDVFKNVELYAGGKRHKFAQLKILGINEDATINGFATKRGTAKKFEINGLVPTVLAEHIDKQAMEASAEPAEDDYSLFGPR